MKRNLINQAPDLQREHIRLNQFAFGQNVRDVASKAPKKSHWGVSTGDIHQLRMARQRSAGGDKKYTTIGHLPAL